MKVFRKPILFIFLLIVYIFNANAEDNEKPNDQKISIYLHLLSIDATCVLAKYYDAPFYLVYLTGEIPLSLSNSLIIQPSIWYMDSLTVDRGFDMEINKIFRLGSGIGLRHFLNGEGDGVYLQAMTDVYYYSIDEHNMLGGRVKENRKGVYADLLGYLGYSLKFNYFKRRLIDASLSLFLDIGVGFAYPTDNLTDLYVRHIIENVTPLIYDFNFGIGMSF